MAIDFDKLRKKAKRRDEQKQIKDNYEYSKSMYEGVKNNRENVSNKTYQKYYNDYKNNTKAYIRDEKITQLNSVLNMLNPNDDVSFSQSKKNFQNAQTKKEELRSTYDKYKDDYERINGQGQTKNKLLSKMEEMSDKLYGDDTVNTEYNRATRRKYEAAQREKEQKEKYQKQQDSNNKLLKNTDIQKLVGSAYKNKQNADIALQEHQRSKQSGQASFGDNVQAENYSIYNKSYETAMQALKKRGYDAESLLDTYTRNMNKQETEKIAKDSSKFADKHPITSRAAYIAAQMGQVAAVPDMIKQGVSNAVSKEYKPMDTNTSAFIATNFRNAVQEKNTENLYNYVKEKSGSDTAGKVVSFLDQTGLSVADMLSIAWLPEPVTLGIMSCGAAANTAVEATQRGLSADKALYTATAAGVAESLFEKISLEKFNALQATGRTGVLNTVKDILKQSFTEGSEEAFTDISNAITDQIINGDMSELSLKYQDYKKQGATEQQARNTVAKDFGMQIGESFLGGALSGAVVGGVGSAINKFSFNDGNARELGFEAKAQSNEDIKNLIDTGLSKDKKSKAYKYAEELNQKAKKTHTINSDNSTDVFSGTSVNNGGVDYSKLSDKRLGQLQLEILKEGFKENISTAVKGEKNEAEINRTVNKIVSGIDLNKSDVENIASSEKALGAINEQFGSDFTNKNISTSALADLSTKLKSGFTDYSFVYDGLNKYQQRTENTTNTTQNTAPNVEEDFSAVQQSNNPRYNVNAVVIDTNGNQSPIKIEGKHPFSISEDKSDIKLRTSAGEIEYNNVNLADNTQRILVNEIVNNNFGNSGANAVYLNFAQNKPENFDGDIRTYVKQAKTIYELGLAKPELSYNDFVRQNSVFIPSLRLLGKTAINIYRAGQTDATNYNNFVVSQRNDVKAPALAVRHIEGEYTNTSNSDSTIDDVFIKTAKEVGVDIERRSDGKSAGNGQFIPSLAKIMVNGDGSGEYNALLHELGEFGLAYNESEYKNVQTAIRDWFVKEKGAEDFNALVDAYVDTYSKAEGSKTREEALNELTNDAISGLFSTDEGIESFVNYLDETKTPAQKKNILETITDFLKSVIEKIKDVIKNSNLQSAAKTAMQMEQKQAEHIRNQFLSVLDGASKNLKNGVEVENKTKNSVTLGKFADVDINSDEKLDKYGISNTANSLNDYVNIQKRVIDTLNNENFFNQNNKNIVVNADTDIVVAITKDGIRETLSSGKRYFSLPRKIKTAKIAVIDSLPDMIRYAEVVNDNEKNYHSKEGSSFLVLNHPAIVDSEDYNVEIKIKKTPVENKFYIHNMNLQNKNETVSLNTKDKIPRGLNSYDLSRTDNIANYATKVKSDDVKYSLDIDSDGNKLTQQQVEYFKNSKVRDEDGNLLKVYHGTSENFTVFDKTKGRANMDIQGMFFSPWELDAKGYGSNVNAYYINITNPASEQMGYKALRKFQGQNNAGVKAREYLESLGYDGVNNENEEFIAFNSNQIKLADNLAPTENEDIRFSRDVDYSYEELTKKPDMKITRIDDSIDYKANSISRKNIIETAIDNAKKIGKVNENGNAVIYVDDIKTDIIVSKSAIRHSLDRRLSINAPVVINVGSILKNSIRINELVPRSKYIENSYALIGIAKNNDNEPYVVSFVVNRHNNEIQSIDVLYAVNAKKEVAALNEPEFRPINGTALTTSKISISNLLNYVNNYFPDILPESVLKHYGYNSRPEGNIGESALFSRDVDYAEYSQLKRENKHLKEVNELLKHQFELTNGREVSTNALLAAGRNIMKLTPTRVTGVEVAEDMKTWHTLDTSAQLYNAAYNLAEKLIDNERKQKYQPTDQEQEMLDYLKNTKIKLSDKQKSEVAYYYGSYGKYRNAARGKINITDDGILLDDLSNEMEEMFGNLILNDNSQDLPITLLDLVNTYKDRYIDNEYGYDKQEYLESLANDILSVYFKTPLYETKADKTEKRFLKARSRYAERVNQYQKELASEKEKHRKEFSDFRRQLLQQNREYRANLKEETVQYKADYRKKQKEKREKSMLYKSFQRSAIRLAQLAKQDKKKHIPNNMVEAVKGIVDVISFGSKLDSEIYSKLNFLDRSFKSLKNNDDYEMVTSVYNNYVSQRIDQLQTMIGDRTAKDLTIDELRAVDDLVRTTVQVCNNVNKLFYAERNKTIESSVSKVSEELEKFKGNKKLDLGIIDSIKYGSMKPEYFFEYLGSDELLKLYRDVRKGEDTWAVTVDNSRNYANDVRDKHKWKEWNRKKRYEITTAAGDKLNLNLEQLMAIYAMSNRRQTLNHIVHGGVVITDKPKSAIQTLKDKNYKWNDSLTHKLAFEDIAKIKSMLTEEQKSYVRDMVNYISTDMAEKGNEISRQLYDVELFKEENYYPARTAKNYMHKSSVETIGAKKLINSGFTNATIEKAENPLLLEEFDTVWASHIDEMASYNAFALPLENFDRVYNYQSSNGDNYNSIRTLVENAYGKKATSYISDLLEDLNGGVIHEAGSDVVDKLTSMFKKNAVFASASVAIQQPSAIGRALSIIDTKYFAKTTFTKRSYEEIKKYAPIAIIKEMGYFDTNMAQSTVDYLNNVNYKGKEKLSAFFKDGSFRDEVFGIAASKADEMTWAHIWNACKAETKDKHPELTGEESLKKAGERFTEVITKTQVYDSVFSRSALMRSKNGAVKMATAFMAEPTTSLNMLVNATVQAKRGKFSKKKATRIVASLVIASVINSLLQSIVTAARNDDDDKTYFEKYLAELIPNFIDNANPVNQIAFVKDVVSIFQGYDVTRADMSVVSDLYNSINNLNSDKLSFEEKTESLAGALGAFFGLPIKNVIRDINSVANVVKGAKKDFKFDSAMTKEATKSNIKETLLTDDALAVFGLDLFPEKDKNQMIYESIINDDKQMYKRIADNVNNPNNYIKKGLIENDERVATAGLDYLNGDIKSAISTAKQLESDGFDYELAFKSIKSYASEIEKAIDAVKLDEKKEDTQSKLYNKTDLINAVNSSDKSIIKTIIDNNIKTDMDNGKTKSEAEKSIKSSLSSAFKEEYLSDESKRKEIKSKLKVTGYFDDEDFTNWEASSYNTEAMIEAFKTNDTKTIQSYVNKRVEAKVANGMTEDNAVFGLKTSITNQYKQKFINGNADERALIITIMTKSGLYGDRKKVIAYINQYWLK